MKNFQNWPETWGWIGSARNETEMVLCIVLTGQGNDASFRSSWANLFKKGKSSISALLQAPQKSDAAISREFLRSLVYSGSCELLFVSSCSSKSSRSNALFLEGAALASANSRKLHLRAVTDGHNEGKLNSLLKKNHLRPDLETMQLKDSLLLQAASYLAALYLDQEENGLGSLFASCQKRSLEMEQIPAVFSRDLVSRARSVFTAHPDLLREGVMDYLARAKFPAPVQERFLGYLEEGGSLSQLLAKTGKKARVPEVERALTELKEEKTTLLSFDWTRPFGPTDPQAVHEAAKTALQDMILLERARLDNDFSWLDQACPVSEERLDQAMNQLDEEFSEFISQYNIEEDRPSMPQVFCLEDSTSLCALILDEPALERLQLLCARILLETMHADPDTVSFRFSSVSRSSQERYSRLLDELEKLEGIRWFQTGPQDYASLAAFACSIHPEKPPVFFGEESLLSGIKKTLITQNRFGLVRAESGGRAGQIRDFLREGQLWYEHDAGSIETRQRPGKDQISTRIHQFLQTRNSHDQPVRDSRPYFTGPAEPDEDALLILADPSLSLSLTRKLARAFARGLKPGSIYYISEHAQSEREYQIRVRSLLLDYLYTRKHAAYLKTILADPHLSLEDLDFFMNPAFTLSKLQLLYESIVRLDPGAVRRAVHSSMSLKKMQETLDALPEEPSASSQDLWLPAIRLHPSGNGQLEERWLASRLAARAPGTMQERQELLEQEDRYRQQAAWILNHLEEFWNRESVRKLLLQLLHSS